MSANSSKQRLACGLAFFFASVPASAGSSGATLGASTTVNSNCTISATAVSFGNYDPIGTNKTNPLNNGNAQLSVACVQGSGSPPATPKITVGLDLGLNASGSTRQMKNTTSANYLAYELYQPPSNAPATPCTFPGSVVWNTGAGLFTLTSPPTKSSRTYFICATVPSGKDPLIGTYTDTVTATVNF